MAQHSAPLRTTSSSQSRCILVNACRARCTGEETAIAIRRLGVGQQTPFAMMLTSMGKTSYTAWLCQGQRGLIPGR
jgi:hypothetical protein